MIVGTLGCLKKSGYTFLQPELKTKVYIIKGGKEVHISDYISISNDKVQDLFIIWKGPDSPDLQAEETIW